MKSFLLITIFSTFATLSSGQSYKSDCTSDSSCDKKRFLECNLQSYTCDCRKSTSIWNPIEGLCMVMESHSCSVGHQKAPCTLNSSCISGKCICQQDYLRNGFGLCNKGYGSSCDDNSPMTQCAWRYLLKCDSSSQETSGPPVCRCRGENIDFVWDEDLQKCVSLVGTGCDMNKDNQDDKLVCVKNAHCLNNSCACLSGYSVTPDKKCLLSYGEECDNNAGQFCNKYSLLNCQDDKKCGCEFYGQMEYDKEIQECRMLVGEFCEMEVTTTAETETSANSANSNNILHKCIQDAECVNANHHHNQNHNIFKGKCACVPGKLKTLDRTCSNFRGHGMPCSFAGDCSKADFLTCVITEEQGGLCSCTPHEMFFNGTQCLVFPGESCSENRKCGQNSNCDGEFCLCDDGFTLDPLHSECVEIKKPEPEAPREVEMTEYEKDQRLRETEELKECPGIDPDSLDFAKCICLFRPQLKIWSEDRASCLGLVDTFCEDDSSCTENAFCEMEDKVCQCHIGARTTLNRTCLMKRKPQNEYQTNFRNQYDLDDKSEFERMNPKPVNHSVAPEISTSFNGLVMMLIILALRIII